MKTCESLRAAGFYSVRMIEVRTRPFDARVVQLETPDVGRPWTASSVVDLDSAISILSKTEETGDLDDGGENEDDTITKKQKIEDCKSAVVLDNDVEVSSDVISGEKGRAATGRRKQLKIPPAPHSVLCARPSRSMKGHSAFLTFGYSPISG